MDGLSRPKLHVFPRITYCLWFPCSTNISPPDCPAWTLWTLPRLAQICSLSVVAVFLHMVEGKRSTCPPIGASGNMVLFGTPRVYSRTVVLPKFFIMENFDLLTYLFVHGVFGLLSPTPPLRNVALPPWLQRSYTPRETHTHATHTYTDNESGLYW
jgi:hypothetical protein